MKNTKKIVAMALAIIMMLTVVTACANESVLSTSEPTDEHNHTEAAPTTEPAVEPTEVPTEAKEVQYASVVYVSVNPLFAIYFDADGKVVKATAENDDGTALDIDLEAIAGMTSTMAMESMLDTIAEAGYFADGEHDIELTFYGEDESEVEDAADLGELEKAIYEAAVAYVAAKEIKAEVKAKTSPVAASVKLEAIEKLSEPTEAPTEAPTEEATVEATEPTQAPATKPTQPSHQHDYQSEVIAPTCTEDGYTKHTCSTCGSSYTDNYTKKTVAGHVYKDTYVPATEETGGYILHECTLCDNSYKSHETLPLGQDPTYAPGEEIPTCPWCSGAHYVYQCPSALEHNVNNPPEPIKCGYCGTTDCDYPATGDATLCPQYDEKKDATKYCQTCGKSTSVCHRYTVDTDCHYCGVPVPAWTCHYC